MTDATTANPSVHERLLSAQRTVREQGIRPTGTGPRDRGEKPYYRLSDVAGPVFDACAEAGLVLAFDALELRTDHQAVKTKDGERTHVVAHVLVRMTATDQLTGESVSRTRWGSWNSTEWQTATQAAQSSATRQLLLAEFWVGEEERQGASGGRQQARPQQSGPRADSHSTSSRPPAPAGNSASPTKDPPSQSVQEWMAKHGADPGHPAHWVQQVWRMVVDAHHKVNKPLSAGGSVLRAIVERTEVAFAPAAMEAAGLKWAEALVGEAGKHNLLTGKRERGIG